ncbi:MAG: LysR family transcriptional regulator ArgP [Nocardioides sp.]
MQPHPDQLAASAAIVEQGTFEAAARRLHVTTSAISQRIRALESAAGQVLIRRSNPCVATPAGEAFVRLARQVSLLYEEAAGSLTDDAAAPDLTVAVSADSLATWFRAVVGQTAHWQVALRLHVEDQGFSADLLRRGEVLAAVTSDPVAVQGCAVERLGVLRYRPAAAPAFAERWRHGRGYDWTRMPMIVFNDKDTLQHELLRERDVGVPSVVHRVPTSADFHEAVRLGLGWGLLPEPQLSPDLRDGRLVKLSARQHLDVALHWQRWRIDSPALTRLTDAVRAASASALR